MNIITFLRAGGNADVIEEFIETGKIETSFLGVIGQIGKIHQ